MIRLLLSSLLLFATLVANEISTFDLNETNQDSVDFYIEEEIDILDLNDTNQSTLEYYPHKVLYLNYKEVPKRVLKGEIFSVTLKTLSTIQNSITVQYELSNHKGVKPLNNLPYTQKDSKYFYDTFYFLATSSQVRLPDFTATLITNDHKIYKPETIQGTKLNVVTLNPKKDFANIIADSFELVEYKTTSFDNQHNILILVAEANNCDISAFHFNGVKKQGIESIYDSIFKSRITYFAVINKDIENFSFSYFNLQLNTFSLVNIPIIVHDDSVTTQSDLKPKDQSRERLKMSIAAAVALIIFLFIIWRKKYIYLIFVIIPVIYIAYLAIPQKDVCIKNGAHIYLLPVKNGTIFETASSEYYLQKEGSVKEFVKVKLKNEKIGWVKNEDICSY